MRVPLSVCEVLREHVVLESEFIDRKTDAFVADIERFVAEQGVQMVSFAKHQRKDDVTRCDDAHIAA